MGIYYAFWNLMLLLPEVIKLFIEVLMVASFILLLWPLDKHIIIALFGVGRGLNYLIFGGVRFAVMVFPGERKYIWDDKIGKCGAKNNTWLQDKCSGLRKSKRKDILHAKAAWFVVFCFYIVSSFPFFHMEKHISEPYISKVYALNHLLGKFEAKLTTRIENYPPFWIREDEAVEEEMLEVVSEEIREEEERAPVWLKLNEDTSYAHIRENADIHSESLCVVSKEDEILYQDIYEYDAERFWLKVTLPSKSNLEGWISAKVIEPEIIRNLELQ